MLESLVPNTHWGGYEDVPILITPPQEECLSLSETPFLSSSLEPLINFDLDQPMLDQSLPNSSFTSLRSDPNLHFDVSDSECEFSGYGSFVPSPFPSPLGDTFGFEEDTTTFSNSCRRDSFTYSDTSELNEEVNNLFIQDLPFTHFTNVSTDTLSPPQSTCNARTRSVSMSAPQVSQEREPPFPYPSPYANLNAGLQSFIDLPTTAQGLRTRAHSLSALPMYTPTIPTHTENCDIYNVVAASNYSDGYSPVASPPFEQFQFSMNASVESLPNLSSPYHSYEGYEHHYDSNGSSGEYFSLEDTVPGSEYHQHHYNLTDLSSHPYPMKGKRGRSHICHFCQRPFTRKHDLHRHIRVHTGDKPYKCQFCEKTFARTDALKRHFRVDEECRKAYEAAHPRKEESSLTSASTLSVADEAQSI